MNRILTSLSMVAVTAFVACSDSSSGSPAANTTAELPTIEGAPSQTTLESNYNTPATAAQVEEDLASLAEMDELGTTMGDLDLSPSFPSMGAIVKKNTNLAKKQLLAWGTCETYPVVDTAYERDGMSYTEYSAILDGNGDPLEVCEPQTQAEANELISLYSNMTMVSKITGTSDTVDMAMNMVMLIKMEGMTTGKPTTSFEAQANFLIDVKIPKPFNAYMELTMSVPTSAVTDTTEPEIQFNMTMWFQNGRYKCVIDMDAMESSNAKVCDLTNAGNTVGSLWNDENGDMLVKDVDGNEISPDAVINEEL